MATPLPPPPLPHQRRRRALRLRLQPTQSSIPPVSTAVCITRHQMDVISNGAFGVAQGDYIWTYEHRADPRESRHVPRGLLPVRRGLTDRTTPGPSVTAAAHTPRSASSGQLTARCACTTPPRPTSGTMHSSRCAGRPTVQAGRWEAGVDPRKPHRYRSSDHIFTDSALNERNRGGYRQSAAQLLAVELSDQFQPCVVLAQSRRQPRSTLASSSLANNSRLISQSGG